MDKLAMDAMYDTLTESPDSVSRESLLEWIQAAQERMDALETEIESLYEDAAGESI